MPAMVILAALAAMGLLSVLWALFGWLLPDGRGMALVCWQQPDEGMLARAGWLRSLGLLRLPVIVVTARPEQAYPGTEICSREELLPRLERERKRSYGTGNGDHSGRGQRGDLSEL